MSVVLRGDSLGVVPGTGRDGLVAVFLLLVQQGAFLSLPMVMAGVSDMRDLRNPVNTAAVVLSLVLVAASGARVVDRISRIARTNLVASLFVGLVLLSAVWSIHPDLTIRRGTGYVLSVLIAAYLPARFDLPDVMRLFSLSFAVSAIGSFAFVAAFPAYGIMQEGDLAGTWRGVFAHKEVLGPVMAVAVFVELYLLVSQVGRKGWRVALLGAYAALILLSQSKTALILALSYGAGACVYLAWRRDRSLGVVGLAIFFLALCIPVTVFVADPDLAFALIGKDTTLSGRTEIWPAVLEAAKQRPLLGWGYRAVWQPDDPATARIDDLVGWAVPSSHNGFLEIALQLGMVGVTLIVLMLVVAIWRGIRCCASSASPLGWFSIVFCAGLVTTGQVLDTIGQNQVIEWVVFNTLLFACGLCLVRDDGSATPFGAAGANAWQGGVD